MCNFKPVKNFWFWCQKVLPLVYDDSISYYEVLCKLSEYLNQVINNVNALPNIIDEAIKEYIESGDIQSALNEMLQNFNPINVKNPPAGLTAAKGDGSEDDTAALQAMIEYGANNDLPLIFPAGIYRVSSLSITTKAYFLGVGNPTIFKAPNTDNALINVEGEFSAFNTSFNGNIAGNVNPADIITGVCDNISVSQCVFSGCVSCIDASVTEILEVLNCHFDNYTEYGVHAKGTGKLIINGMEIDNVANSGAMRFVRIDTSNSVVENLTSLAEVPIGVEITGDFNEITARIPNCETPVNDGGQNNSYNVIGQSVQKKVTGKMAYSANEGEETMSSKKVINAADIVLNPTNPLTYKTPTELSEYFNTIPYKDYSGTPYNVLVSTEKTVDMFGGVQSVKNFGAKGDGVTDDTQAIKTALASNSPVYFPMGNYRITETLDCYNSFIVGAGKQQTFIIMDGNGPIINAGSRFVMAHITLKFTNADGAGYGEKIALNCYQTYALQRTIIYDVNIDECGTAIKSGTEPLFSVVFDTMEITNFSYAAIDIDTVDSTQNAFRNLYITSDKEPEYMIIVNTRMSSIYFENINLEWTAPKHAPLCLFGILTVTINGIQFERITLQENVMLMSLDCRQVVINRFTNIFNNIGGSSTYAICIDMGPCLEFGDFGTPDMRKSGLPAKLIINDYTMWGFTFNNNSNLTFLRRIDSTHPANVYINGFNAISYNDDLSKYTLYCQVSENTNVKYNVNNFYGATPPTDNNTTGGTFYDTSDSTLKFWNGSEWKTLQSQ